MSPREIKVGKTYVNKGAGKTMRRVMDIIGPDHKDYRELCDLGRVPWYSHKERPNDSIVVYVGVAVVGNQLTNRPKQHLYMRSFASWCGKEVQA